MSTFESGEAGTVNGTTQVAGQSCGLPALFGGKPVRTPERRIIFGAPDIGQEEIDAVAECLRSGWIGRGKRVAEFERDFARYKSAPFALAVQSGSAALHLALTALGVGPGDEVIAPTMTFCSTVHAIVHTGATPVLADCDRATSNVTADHLERLITPRTKAIMVVHMSGRPCDMAPILDLARQRRLFVVEDCAHAIETTYQGDPAGLMGDVGCFSFYANKNITAGDGGMVVTRERRLHRKMSILSLHGMTGDAWSRTTSGRNEYRVIAPGFKYNLTDIGASLAMTQLRRIDRSWHHRRELWQRYRSSLADLPLVLPPEPEHGTRHAYHLFTPLLALERLGTTRREILRALREEGIGAGIHYVPVHAQPYYRRRFGFQASMLPNAEYVGRRTISLPLSAGMQEADVADACTALRKVLLHYTQRAQTAGRGVAVAAHAGMSSLAGRSGPRGAEAN